MNYFEIRHGDALEALARLPAESVDSMVTDPPAGISFMGKTWDQDRGGRAEWVAEFGAIFAESLRVLKPGAHALVWAIPRTSHWTATAIEDAGFEIRDVVVHLFGTGFPKSLDVSKAIDKAAGAKPVATGRFKRASIQRGGEGATWDAGAFASHPEETKSVAITAPATEAARTWEGWGTALKPAAEHWILCRKPLIGTVASNVLEHGCGALNIDGCRIGTDEKLSAGSRQIGDGIKYGKCEPSTEYEQSAAGRWPANVVLSHSEGCVLVGEKRVAGVSGGGMNRDGQGGNTVYGEHQGHQKVKTVGYADADGLETVPAYECVESCPVRMLDEQSGELTSGERLPAHTPKKSPQKDWRRYRGGPCAPSTGTASRFFYCAKPSTAERNIGQVENRHPTVKSAELMAYFCRLVTPPGGTVLDPFMGSGSTGIAALREGFDFIGIEREAEYVALARHRIQGDAPLLNQEREVEST